MEAIDTLANYAARARAGRAVLAGRYITVRPVNWPHDLRDLSRHLCAPDADDLWDYIGFGPFENGAGMQAAVEAAACAGEWEVMSVARRDTGEVLGSVSFMRNREAAGSTEIGCVLFGHDLQRTRMASEAIYLMMSHVFDDLGYRRLEWKCDSRNVKSRAAALRFGFSYEGLFRQDGIVKGRNRDTAWFSIIDKDWPDIQRAFTAWLDPKNFSDDGQQRKTLTARQD